jgi:hypothetical protein
MDNLNIVVGFIVASYLVYKLYKYSQDFRKQLELDK